MLTVDTFPLSSRAKNTTKNGILMFAASLLGAQHERDSVENKPDSLLLVSLGKRFMGCLHLYLAGLSNRSVVVAQCRWLTECKLMCMSSFNYLHKL